MENRLISTDEHYAVALNAEDSELSASIEEAKALLKKAGGASMALASAMSKVDSIK